MISAKKSRIKCLTACASNLAGSASQTPSFLVMSDLQPAAALERRWEFSQTADGR